MRSSPANQVRYAVLQQSLEIPPVERLRRAFESVRGLTAADAPGVANDAYGILLKNLSAADAQVLKTALQAEGILTEVVPEQMLPQLPPTKFVRRLEFGQDALLIYDPLGRRMPVEYRHLLILAAGTVDTVESRRSDSGASILPKMDRVSILRLELEDPNHDRWTRQREVRIPRRCIELILTGGLVRFTIEVEVNQKLLFKVLSDRQTGDLDADLALLIRQLSAAASGALLNRGAFLLRANPSASHAYPSRNAFREEIIWMLWQVAKRDRG
jgi:hypothetical protein